jgi:NADPH:quinone reductase-like Zn-dependent oxidoreductase
MTFIQAAALPEVFITAYDALFNRLQIRSGETLLIHAAASGVGTAAIQLARSEGVRVFGTASLKSKLETLSKLGLDLPINYREQSFSEEVLKATEGKGVDAILDLVGASHFAPNLDCLAELGRMVVVGLVGGSQVDMDLSELMRKRLTIIGTVLRSRTVEEKARLVDDFEAHTGPLLDSGAIHPVVDRVFPLSLAGQAHTYMESNQNTGKIVLEVG